TQPPETDPATRPSPRMASIAPGGRGEEPHVSTIVARMTCPPSLSQATLLRKTCRSTLSMTVQSFRSIRQEITILDHWPRLRQKEKAPRRATPRGQINDVLVAGFSGARLKLLRGANVLRRKRQGAAALAAGGEDRIADRRLDHRGTGFAETPRNGVAHNEVDVQHLRRLVHARDAVHVEIVLLDTAVLHGDLAPHACRLAEDDSRLHLGERLVRMDQRAGVNNCSNLVDRDVVGRTHR